MTPKSSKHINIEQELNQQNIDYLKNNYWFLLSVGILAVGDRERLEVLEVQDD